MPVRDGSTAATSLTGTVLEHCRKPLATWVSFIRLMRRNIPVECAAELCGVTHKTTLEWRRRVLAMASGYQGRIMLRDTVWVDGAYVNDADLSKGYRQARKRSLSPPEAVHLRRHRHPQEPGRGRLRPRKARLDAREEGHGRQDSPRVATHPRPRAGPRRAGQGGRVRERGA